MLRKRVGMGAEARKRHRGGANMPAGLTLMVPDEACSLTLALALALEPSVPLAKARATAPPMRMLPSPASISTWPSRRRQVRAAATAAMADRLCTGAHPPPTETPPVASAPSPRHGPASLRSRHRSSFPNLNAEEAVPRRWYAGYQILASTAIPPPTETPLVASRWALA